MKLQIFDRSNSYRSGTKVAYRAISFNRRNARATFTAQAASELKISDCPSVIFAHDTESKNNAWYLRLLKTEDGIPVKLKSGTGYCKNSQSYICTSRPVTTAILDSLKAESGACLLIAQKPVNIDGEDWYELITAKPVRKN